MRRVPVPLVPAPVRWLGVAVVAAVIFHLSVLAVPPEQPIVAGPPDFLPLDKWRHFLAYAAFAGSLAYATAEWDWRVRHLVLVIVGLTVGYGVGVEVIQAFLPARYFGLGDAYANAVGGLLVLPWFLLRPHLSFVAIPGDLGG